MNIISFTALDSKSLIYIPANKISCLYRDNNQLYFLVSNHSIIYKIHEDEFNQILKFMSELKEEK